jgi:hypothetical protein
LQQHFVKSTNYGFSPDSYYFFPFRPWCFPESCVSKHYLSFNIYSRKWDLRLFDAVWTCRQLAKFQKKKTYCLQLQPWRCNQYLPPKRWCPCTSPYGVTSKRQPRHHGYHWK